MRYTLCVVVAVGCAGGERRAGSYIEGAEVTRPERDGQRSDRIPGKHFLVDIVHTETPAGCGSERMRQTNIAIELPKRPADGERVDLSTVRVVYEWGGQLIAYRSESCRGGLVLTTNGDVIEAAVDIACDRPTLGDGPRTFTETVDLKPYQL